MGLSSFNQHPGPFQQGAGFPNSSIPPGLGPGGSDVGSSVGNIAGDATGDASGAEGSGAPGFGAFDGGGYGSTGSRNWF